MLKNPLSLSIFPLDPAFRRFMKHRPRSPDSSSEVAMLSTPLQGATVLRNAHGEGALRTAWEKSEHAAQEGDMGMFLYWQCVADVLLHHPVS